MKLEFEFQLPSECILHTCKETTRNKLSYENSFSVAYLINDITKVK